MRPSLRIRDVQCAEGGLRRKARAPGRPLRAPDRQRLKKENKQKTIMDTPRGPFPHSLARKTRAPLPRDLDAQAHSIPEAGKALRKRARLQVGTWPQNRKEHSPTHVLPRCAPGPGAGGHCGWRPARSARPDAPAPAGRPARAPRRRVSTRRGAAASEAARRPDSDYRFTLGARPPSPRRRALVRPRAPARLFFSIHADAQRRRRRRQRSRRRRRQPPDWLAAAEPALSHGPWRVRLSGGAAGAAPGARPGQSGRAGRGGPRPPARRCPARPPRPAPPPSHQRRPAKPPRSRRSAAKLGLARGRSRGSPWPQPRPRPPLSSCQSAERGAGLAEGRLLPGSRRPAPAPAPSPAPCTPRPPQGPGKGRSVGKGWLSFNRRQSVSGSVCAEPEQPAAESRRCC